MSVGSEITSGKFTIYAQWSAIIAIILLVALGISNFLSVLPFAIIGWVEAFLMIFLEIPFLTTCCPGGPKMTQFQQTFQNTLFRSILYAAFSVLMFLSILMSSTSIIAAAVFLAITSVCYFIAVIKKEELARSGMTGGVGMATTAARGTV